MNIFPLQFSQNSAYVYLPKRTSHFSSGHRREHKTIWVIHLSVAPRGFTAPCQTCCLYNLLIKMLLAVYAAYLKSQGSRICSILRKTKLDNMEAIKASPGGSSLCVIVWCSSFSENLLPYLHTLLPISTVTGAGLCLWREVRDIRKSCASVCSVNRAVPAWCTEKCSILRPRWSNCICTSVSLCVGL